MTPEVALDIFREAIFIIMLMVAVMVVPSLLVGLIVSMFQAATQINEQTLSFLPRLLITLTSLVVAGPWLLNKVMDFFIRLLEAIPTLIG
ncbi:flagellar biosynthesis protein FliQ [Dasania sp. GY-MA-18]|uniref:Flagellar biosynthetic protein FliQ n=1 Tax=Dasania phycosphaerae TaxID=2950436 RepID=A0A9J6RIL8_9GAMM|nr:MULTISPECIES: flagellar biosynthesis protein FliQ [Dasania]MCR8921668.1 flagellar biosynthesis protein FliQ [Dasania sp. GY-MA-18]MCZ0864096.1 flagellar biosynthesis protein FliQ [Dasania phycosphaerae]MCZ0867824.1 flagellar biosynthesis protein FliQ [Dasania phycosphaerae]